MAKTVGFTKVSNKIIRTADLSVYARAIYMVLGSFSEGRRWPSYKYICACTGIKSKSTAIKYMKELVSKDIIRFDPGSRKGSHRRTNYYEILPEDIWNLNVLHWKTCEQVIECNGTNTNNEMVPVHGLLSNKINNNINEIQPTSFLKFTTGDFNAYQKKAITNVEMEFRKSLMGGKFFQEAPILVRNFTEEHGPLVPLKPFIVLISNRFTDEKGKKWSESLIRNVTDAYENGLALYHNKNTPCETKDERRERIKKRRKEQLARAVEEGLILQRSWMNTKGNSEYEEKFNQKSKPFKIPTWVKAEEVDKVLSSN